MEVLIVGLDGLSFNMLSEFDVDADYLDRVGSEGSTGPLWSVDAPTTLPAWTSFATGKDPASHGITNMLQQGRDYDIDPARPNDTDAAAYDLFDDAVFVNLPATVTREPAGDAKLVSSFLATDAAEAIPPEFRDLDGFDDYVVKADTSLKSDPDVYVEHICEIVDARHRFARAAFERYDPRVGFVLFSAPDWVGHHLTYAEDPDQQGEWYRRVVERVDAATADLATGVDNVLLLSDHGFERKPKTVHLQNWLRDEGHLQIREADVTTTQRLTTGAAKALATTFRPAFDVARDVYLRLNHGSDGDGVGDLVNFNPDIDFAASDAWQLRYGCLYVNDDRFDSPAVEDSEAFRRELRDELQTLTDDDGTPIFQDVLFPEEAYADPDEMAPDIIARPAEGYLPLRAFSPTDSYVKAEPGTPKYDHRYEGLLAATGPLFESGATVGDVSIVDILPTLLHALGEPLLSDFDGCVQTELLATDETPRIRDDAAVPDPRTRRTEADRDETVRERLADMGYLE
jgi:predicted AlkP superfamily phosphohydrolase/phosphomutase